MREGKFLEINKNQTNFLFEKGEGVGSRRFAKIAKEYAGFIEEENGETFRWLRENEVEVSPEKEEVINDVLEKAKQTIKNYSGKDIEISRNQVVIVRPGSLASNGWNVEATGGALLEAQRVVIESGEHDSNSEFADKVFHELMHLGSFYRMRYQKKSDHPQLGPYKPERTGLKILNREGQSKFFGDLDEALTEILTQRYLQAERENPLYREEFILGEKEFGDRLQGGTLAYRPDLEDESKVVPVMSHSYEEERKATAGYIQGIYDKNKDRFKNVDEVWEVFFQAKFTGRLLQLARLIEKTGGKGEFRRLGEISNG